MGIVLPRWPRFSPWVSLSSFRNVYIVYGRVLQGREKKGACVVGLLQKGFFEKPAKVASFRYEWLWLTSGIPIHKLRGGLAWKENVLRPIFPNRSQSPVTFEFWSQDSLGDLVFWMPSLNTRTILKLGGRWQKAWLFKWWLQSSLIPSLGCSPLVLRLMVKVIILL